MFLRVTPEAYHALLTPARASAEHVAGAFEVHAVLHAVPHVVGVTGGASVTQCSDLPCQVVVHP